MPTSDCFVSVVAPIHDEGAIVVDFVVEVMDVLISHYTNYELVLVNDGSTDDTVKKVEPLLKKYNCIRLINLSRNYGEEIAISAGLDSVIGDYVVIMIPNTDPPHCIPEMVELARNGNGVVFGVVENRQKLPWWSSAGSNLFYWYSHKVLGLPFPRYSTKFRVLSRQVVNAVTQIRDRYRYIRTASILVGYQSHRFPYTPINRSNTPNQRNLFESVNLAIDIVVANSKRPLRFVSWLGLMASIFNLLYIVYIVGVNFFKRTVEGWTTSSVQNATMFFFILLILTVLSEYIGRILEETIDRPLYFVMGEMNSSVMLASSERRNVVTELEKTGAKVER